jgi:hypothetical protein
MRKPAHSVCSIGSSKEAGMASNTGIDPLRGRPTPGIASTEEKIQKRKIDALRRGVHRIKSGSEPAFNVHLIGVGNAGTAVVSKCLDALSRETLNADGSRLSVLGIDVGPSINLDAIREHAVRLTGSNVDIQALQLDASTADELVESLSHYPGFLKLEYPFSDDTPSFKPWVTRVDEIRGADGAMQRAIAKAVYGRAYYDGKRPAAQALKRFAQSVSGASTDPLVCICFGLAGGTGSGIVVDLARHLSNVRFGRRMLVVGLGIAPCDGDAKRHMGGHIFPVLNELDCLSDEAKSRGAVAAYGDLYRNPFTAGFLLVPQQHVWDAKHDLKETHERVDRELVSLITARNGSNLWETLRLLNWIAAPSTQHSASRTQYGTKWIHLFGFTDSDDGPVKLDGELPMKLGLLPSYRPEFIEAKVTFNASKDRKDLGKKVGKIFGPEIEPEISDGDLEGSVQFVLPQISKTDLKLFSQARSAYDAQDVKSRTYGHSWLLEHGVVLCEPSASQAGMTGARLWGADYPMGVSFALVRGEIETQPEALQAAG